MVMSKKTIGRVTPAGASREEDMVAGEVDVDKGARRGVMKSQLVEVAFVHVGPREPAAEAN